MFPLNPSQQRVERIKPAVFGLVFTLLMMNSFEFQLELWTLNLSAMSFRTLLFPSAYSFSSYFQLFSISFSFIFNFIYLNSYFKVTTCLFLSLQYTQFGTNTKSRSKEMFTTKIRTIFNFREEGIVIRKRHMAALLDTGNTFFVLVVWLLHVCFIMTT